MELQGCKKLKRLGGDSRVSFRMDSQELRIAWVGGQMAGWPEDQVKSWVSGQVARSKGFFVQGKLFVV